MKENFNKIKKYFSFKNSILFGSVVLLYVVLFVIYYKQFTSFIFFDEFADIVAGKFLLEGKQLYSQQFFNHQMLPVYISSLIQLITKPESLYQLIIYHRVFIFIFSFVAGVLIVSKMRWYGLATLAIYEIIKYYLFGYLFLAESMIVYIHIFLFYLGWKRISKESITQFELWIASIGTWFVLWSREPYVPLVLLLYSVIIFHKNIKKIPFLQVGSFLALSVVTFATVSIPDYIYEVIFVNYKTVLSDQVSAGVTKGLGFFSLFFYPIFTFISGQDTFFRVFLICLSAVFLLALGYFLIKTKKMWIGVYIFFVLVFANVRMVEPGTIYYGAFYQIQWVGLCIAATFLLIKNIFILQKKVAMILSVSMLLATFFVVVQKDSYITRSVDREQLFSFQYDKYYVTANTIDMLAKSGDTLHVDFSESLLYWESKTPPAFKYVVYYPVMNDIDFYKKQRIEMFKNNPPTFYYRNCSEANTLFYQLDKKIQYEYAPIQYVDQVNCLYILKEAARKLSQEQMDAIKANGYTIEPSALR